VQIFVAGGTGAVGRELLPQLTAAGHHVVAITRSPQKLTQLQLAGADAVACDVFDRDRLVRVLRDARPDAVIHQLTDLPATIDPKHLGEIYARNNRVRSEGTHNLLDAAEAAGVARVIVQSMATWYRPEGGAVKTETDPLWTDAPEPIGTAVRTVVEMEAEVTRRAPIAIVLRYGGFYGPGTWYAPDGEFARRMRSRGFPVIGDGSGIMSFIHVIDAASATVAALRAPRSAVYDVADDEPARASDWVPAYAAAIGAPRPLRVPAFLARFAVGSAVTQWATTMRGASNARIKSELSWQPAITSWREGFKSLLAHT
jgi:nucleoside-diphosphate-sugar epimerase